jgi:hypothetical protein
MSNLKTFNIMGILDALKAATANVQSEPTKEKAQAKTSAKTSAKSAPKGASAKPGASKASEKTGAKTDSPRSKGGAKYVIPAEFKQAIEDHLKSRPDMADKLTKKDKSIDGCCDYIFDKMRKRAEQNRGGKSAVGLYAPPEEIFGMAVHYYDESDEDLKKEK